MAQQKRVLSEEQWEDEIVSAFENGKLKSIPNVKSEIQRTITLFKANGKKNKRVNIRLTELDYQHAQARALREGLPYQSLLSSVLHKWLTGQLVEKSA